MLRGEATEQIKLFNACKFIPECKFLFAVPNGGTRNYLEAVNLKRQGVRAGVPDIMLAYPNKKYHGLFIEMKYGKNKPTDNQKIWIEHLNDVGYLAVVCYKAEEAFETIQEYLKGI